METALEKLHPSEMTVQARHFLWVPRLTSFVTDTLSLKNLGDT